jgi:hypothetical protein
VWRAATRFCGIAAGTIHKRGELFLIFTAYFDEADTHGPAPTVILAAWMGHDYQWRRFEKKLPPIQQLRKFKTFHTVDIKPGALARPNSKWDETSAQATVDDLTDLVRLTKLDGIAIALDHQRYMTEYRAPPIPKRMNLDSQYKPMGPVSVFCDNESSSFPGEVGFHLTARMW